KKHRLAAAVDHAVARVERDREQTPLLPLEMHLAAVIAGRPDLRRAETGDDVDQLFVKMIFRVERAARRDLADVHAGEAFHAFEIDVGAPAAGALPRLERQLGHVFDAVAVDHRNPLFLEPHLVTGFALGHVSVLSPVWIENNRPEPLSPPIDRPRRPTSRADSRTTAF